MTDPATAYAPTATLAPKAESFIPHSYVLARQFTKCTGCGTEYESCAFSLVRHYTPPGSAQPMVQSIIVEVMAMELPIGIATMKPKIIPVCGKCYCTLPERKQRPIATEQNWKAAVLRDAHVLTESERKRQAELAKERKQREAALDTLDDL